MCAICLGLGGAPKLLGRAKDVSHATSFGSSSPSLICLMSLPQVKHYVKNGKDTGFVEIELYVEFKLCVSLDGVHYVEFCGDKLCFFRRCALCRVLWR